MSTAIRYFSKFGHTAKMANIVCQVTGAKPELVSVPLTEPVDTLYIGSGVFLGKISDEMADFIRTLKPENIGRVVCFGSSAIIKSPVPQMQQLLEAQGIKVAAESFTCKGSMGPLHIGHPNHSDLENLRTFIQSTL